MNFQRIEIDIVRCPWPSILPASVIMMVTPFEAATPS